MSCVKADQPLVQKAAGPARNKPRVAFKPIFHSIARGAVFQHENQLRAAHLGYAHRPAAHRRFQLIPFRFGQMHFSHTAHLDHGIFLLHTSLAIFSDRLTLPTKVLDTRADIA